MVWAYLAIQDRLNASKEEFSRTIAAYTGLPNRWRPMSPRPPRLGQFLTLDQMQRQAATFHQLGVRTKDVQRRSRPVLRPLLIEAENKA